MWDRQHTFPGASFCCFTKANQKKNKEKKENVVEETVALNLTVSFIPPPLSLSLSVFVWQRPVGAAEPATGAAAEQLRQNSTRSDPHPGEKHEAAH